MFHKYILLQLSLNNSPRLIKFLFRFDARFGQNVVESFVVLDGRVNRVDIIGHDRSGLLVIGPVICSVMLDLRVSISCFCR